GRAPGARDRSMIPVMNIVAWGNVVPWAEQRQIEQDLIISRAIVAMFSDPFLVEQLRFRGGTALNKLHFPKPLRYSEDIDLVRTTAGPIGPVLDRVREVMEPWLGKATFDQSPVAPKLRFRTEAEAVLNGAPIRLKVEINTREIEAYDPPLSIPFSIQNPWFTGAANVATFSREEMLATKLRALLQRNKGRDLFDLDHALDVFENLDAQRIVACLARYLQASGLRISRAEAQERMFAKLANPEFFTAMRPLLPTDQAERLKENSLKKAFERVVRELIDRMPGDPWVRADEMRQRFGLVGQTRSER
ncbi:MAG: nucleotidyl transferase AbiEii/AbiGii toxin family protein, partial [Aestuariivirga sp.]